ncbi:MAG: TolC family protein [Bryobacteraceae bacterium]
MRFAIVPAVLIAVSAAAQQSAPSAPQAGAEIKTAPTGPQFTQPGTATAAVALDLPAALALARNYNQQFMQAYLAAGLAREDRLQARAALFPTVTALSQYVYTQGNGTPSGVFVANDGVHIYNDQAIVHADLFSLAKRADYQRTIAAEAAARARQEIAARGLTAAVVQTYYNLITAQRHDVNARRSLSEAAAFLDLTQKQERGGEVARADVIKAKLQFQQRQRDVLDAQTNVLKAKMSLGVILFPDVSQQFSIRDDLRPDAPLPQLDEVHRLATTNNPDIRGAEANIKQSEASIASAKAAYYPTVAVDYFYGIDANVLDIRGPADRKNLGSVVQGTLTVPIWNWGATRSKIRQAGLQRRQAEYDLTFAQRGLQSNLNLLYLESQTARAQLESLRTSLDLSIESLRLTVLRYQAGEATALEVTDAQNTLNLARNAYDDGLARYRVALANLQVLTGGF